MNLMTVRSLLDETRKIADSEEPGFFRVWEEFEEEEQLGPYKSYLKCVKS